MRRDTFERALHLWPDWGDSIIGNRQPLSYDLKWPQQECKDWANKNVTEIRKQDEAGF
jgi:lysophospholipase L1-like esterase